MDMGVDGFHIRQQGWTAVVGGDTAGSAEMVSQNPDMEIAAIAPRLAADMYGLDVLAEHVEDADHNTTRFVVLSKQADWAPHGGDTVTTFIFKVRNVPAALYKVMGGFATNNVNMTKLESYQFGGTFTATLVYDDIEGHPDMDKVKLAMEEMNFFSRERHILGVYPAAARRDSSGH